MGIAVVYQDHTLGILGRSFGKPMVETLGGLASKGGASVSDGPILFVNPDDIRRATLDDFDTFRVNYNPAYELAESLAFGVSRPEPAGGKDGV